MRTTVDIPNHLMKKAKMKAIEEGITFKELITRSLHKEVNEHLVESKKPWEELRGMGSTKNLKPEDTVFDEEWEPESEFYAHANKSDSDSD